MEYRKNIVAERAKCIGKHLQLGQRVGTRRALSHWYGYKEINLWQNEV
jgi:hypothetical protein